MQTQTPSSKAIATFSLKRYSHIKTFGERHLPWQSPCPMFCFVKKWHCLLMLAVVGIIGCDLGKPLPRGEDSAPEANVTNPTGFAPSEEVAKRPTPSPTPELPSAPSASTPSIPQAPAFTPELLRAVKNWQAVPPSVFPLGGITLKRGINFEIKTPSGQLIGNIPVAEGKEVVAIGLVDGQLHVSPSKISSQRASLPIDQTDFKTCVAYLFEVRKRQYAAYEVEVARRKTGLVARSQSPASRVSSRPSPHSRPKRGRRVPESGTLFEDIPPPMDFGHGKFCVCGDCRRKRKAAAGD